MIFDVIVLIITLISAFIAFLRGLIREVLTIFGVVGGLAAAWYAGPMLLPYMKDWLGVKEGAEPEKLLGVLPYDILAVILAYGIIFIVVALVLSIVSHILAETARAIGLGPVDRTLGVIFGIARGILLVSIPVMVMQLITSDEQREEWFKDSKTYFYVDQVSVALLDMVPDSTVEKFKEDAETIKESASTREKLQQMDILKGGAPREEELPPAESGTEGYTNEFRDEMDQLFESRPTGQERAPVDPADEEPNQ
ncbi:MAG: CvpA family protein [Alphaproteobacteria bacterium]|jgi:membrane protein required for colicin V production|nr:CvpA family protein [Alphaproteobacteria bacterium]